MTASTGARAAPVLLAAALALAGCASSPPPEAEAPPTLGDIYAAYLTVPGPRAMAVAWQNDPSVRWVYAIRTAGSEEEAVAEALAACVETRDAEGLATPCRVYAIGDALVWGRIPH